MAVFREPTNIAMDRKGSRKTLDQFYKSVLFETDGLFDMLFPDGKLSDDETRNEAMLSYYKGNVSNECADNEGSSNTCSASTTFRANLEGTYRFTTKDHRMPQIAAYAKTPMRYTLQNTTYINDDGVHVLSLVGSGFDALQQPDYQYFFDKQTQDIRIDRQQEFFRERQIAFAIALQCASDHRLDRIEFVAVGAGAFAVLLPRDRVLQNIMKAWESDEVQAFKKRLQDETGREIKLAFRTQPPHSHNNGLGPGIPSFYEESKWTGEGHGKDWRDAVNRTLFINAWDPWSLVGNGNDMDYSVDGMYGRQSALSLLCWPIANHGIRHQRVDI
jgi:hypothetical protein